MDEDVEMKVTHNLAEKPPIVIMEQQPLPNADNSDQQLLKSIDQQPVLQHQEENILEQNISPQPPQQASVQQQPQKTQQSPSQPPPAQLPQQASQATQSSLQHLQQPPPTAIQQPPLQLQREPDQVQQLHSDFDSDDFFEFKNSGRGGFRGRPWNPGGGPPRFRGRGFGPGGPNMMRGRGGPPSFFRGRGGPPGGRFPGPNFDSNWGPNNMGAPGGFNPPPGFGNAPLELWVETKSEDGKSYFYHAITRETTWTRPEGPNIKIMTQADVEAMNARNQQQQQQHQAQQQPQNSMAPQQPQQQNQMPPQQQPLSQQQPPQQSHTTAENNQKESPSTNINHLPNSSPSVAKEIDQSENQITPNVMNNGIAKSVEQLPASMPPSMQQPAAFFPGAPPHFGAPPFGMPPPGYGGYPPAGWGVPWAMQSQHIQDQPAKTLIIKPGVIDPAVIARAAEWSEHRAPDGRPYYYHTGRGESVWEKPQAIRDLEAARMAAHSGATPQSIAAQTTATTTMVMGQAPIMTPAVNLVSAGTFDPMAFAPKPMIVDQNAMKADAQDLAEKDKKKKEQEKKKKEEEEKIKQATKIQDKSRPVSSTPIAGTPWCVVWTGDGRVFFYNPSTRTSVWERPEELLERADVDKAVSTPPEQLIGTLEKEKKKDSNPSIEITIINSKELDQTTEEETPSKKLKLSVNEHKQPEKKVDVAKEAAMEAEVRAAKERALVPLETRVRSFKEMLREKDVSAFSTWEKELHKIVFDPRYLLLTSRERKQVFEKYVKERAEEERKEKRNKMRQKRDEFRKLMEEAGLHGKSSFSEFSQRYGKDDRYKAIEKVRERESLFNEYIVDVRRREKEEKIHRKEAIKKNFIEMLRERSDIDRHCRWPDVKKKIESDSRYRAIDNSLLREDYYMEYCKIMKDEKRRIRDRERDRKEKDREREREREREKKSERREKEKSKQHRDKEKDKDREKEKEKEKETKDKSDEETEKKNSEDHEDGERPSTSDDEAERLQKERDRQLRAEQSIKEREKEVQRTLAGHLRERDKEREHHKRDEAVRHFSALLADLVRNPDLAWKEVKRQLRKDHRWELVENLEREDRERIFNDHIGGLMKKKRDKFREMLDELPSLELTSSWKDIKKLIREDPRYLKYSSSEKSEREFKDYIKDKTMEAKTSLRELLQECKLVTHKSFEIVQETPNHLKEIEEILKNDKRYLVLGHMAAERTQIIMAYLEDLHKRGPPPPPTASESTRRK